MVLNLNGSHTIILIQRDHLNGPILNAPPNNNIDPGGPGALNLIFANQFKNAPTKIFKCPQFKLPSTIILLQGALAHSI